MRLPDASQIQIDESFRDAVLTAMEVVSHRSSLPVVISVEPGTPFSKVDTLLDFAAQSQTKSIFLRTSQHRGVVFEKRERARPESPTSNKAKTPRLRADPRTPTPPQTVSPPSMPDQGQPVRFVVGGAISEPVKLEGPEPFYPNAAQRASIQGVVVLEAVIGTDGLVQDLKVLRPLPLGLSEAAEDAVKKWRYQPATLEGEPLPVKYIITVRFKLQ
jgi:TonB family protein